MNIILRASQENGCEKWARRGEGKARHELRSWLLNAVFLGHPLFHQVPWASFASFVFSFMCILRSMHIWCAFPLPLSGTCARL